MINSHIVCVQRLDFFLFVAREEEAMLLLCCDAALSTLMFAVQLMLRAVLNGNNVS